METHSYLQLLYQIPARLLVAGNDTYTLNQNKSLVDMMIHIQFPK